MTQEFIASAFTSNTTALLPFEITLVPANYHPIFDGYRALLASEAAPDFLAEKRTHGNGLGETLV